MKTKNANALPKTAAEITNGGVYRQRVRCGKPNCKCARGELHTAHFFFTRRAGKLVKIYVRKAELDDFTRLVDHAAAERCAHRRWKKETADLLKKMRQLARERAVLINALRGK